MTEELQRADNDSPWKEILEAYFPQAMQFFFPQTAALINWERPHEFLDKEFQQIALNEGVGSREEGVEKPLFCSISSLLPTPYSLFCSISSPLPTPCLLTWRPNQYSYNYPDTRLNFEFGIVKLLDYQNNWAELEASDNPFATVVMAHLKTQQTSKKPGERKTWKFSLIRRLYELGLQERDIRNLYRFIDWVMILPKALEAEFWQEFKQFEQERTMSYITTGERIGYERGKEEGKQEQGQTLVIRQLQKRVGELPEEVRERIQTLSLEQLESLGEALLDFTAIEDLLNWLSVNQTT
ncbi:DUF4351 domain-containing protein (plasmid) [Nostoc edaphicum CCNP1411]|uniref:DUF4351 domain-containing protein n=1 Tax=Nostoc edaphicum CCNP1411 TaxID=1472755 RepID=A0A7D7QJU7_9NOSO|nr:DUF4351 domain-containing protein [Nostoc edaphicum]QMS86540.1 DUF4351 domain-containing protein [Nostoc edaphicum CCNP1411]